MEAAVAELEHGSIEVAGVRRTYWAARAPRVPGQPPGPLLIVLHGSGTSGQDVATTFTGLASRGPTAGVTVVFPDGWRGVWHVMGGRPPASRTSMTARSCGP